MAPHKSLVLVFLVSTLAPQAWAQFGARKDEVVIYALTSKGPMAFTIVPPGTVNHVTSPHFEVIETAKLPGESVVPGFPERSAQTLHREPDDLFQMITQIENEPTPRALFTAKGKEFTLKGLLRDDNVGSNPPRPLDFLPGGFAPFTPGVAVGPDRALQEVAVLLWRPNSTLAPFRQVPIDFVGPAVPPGLTGPEFEIGLGVAPFFLPWTPIVKKYPNAGWREGVDLKFIEEDPELRSTIQLIRLRPGKSTPLFTIPGATHMFVLEGQVDITPAGGTPSTLKQNWYAFVPNGFAISLSNPKPYRGPGAVQ